MPHSVRISTGVGHRSKRFGGRLSKADKALNVARETRKLISPEYKSHSVDLVADPSIAGSTTNLTAIAVGTALENRIGNRIQLKYLSIRGSVSVNNSATFSHVRIVVVRDNNGSTTQPSIASLYASVTDFVNNENKIGDTQRNSRFTVLMDRFIALDVLGPRIVPFKMSKSLDSKCFFSGSATTDEGKGALYLFLASNEATNDPQMTANAVVKWLG